MSREHDTNVRLSAWLDGELDAGEAKPIEKLIGEDPETARELASLKAVSAAMRRGVDVTEARLDLSNFSANVMAAIDESEAEAGERALDGQLSTPGADTAPSIWRRLLDGVRELGGSKVPALAAAAMMMVAVGFGSYHYLLGGESDPMASTPLVLSGGQAVIEEIRSEGSAIVYRTESDVTLIWVTEDV